MRESNAELRVQRDRLEHENRLLRETEKEKTEEKEGMA